MGVVRWDRVVGGRLVSLPLPPPPPPPPPPPRCWCSDSASRSPPPATAAHRVRRQPGGRQHRRPAPCTLSVYLAHALAGSDPRRGRRGEDIRGSRRLHHPPGRLPALVSLLVPASELGCCVDRSIDR